MSGLKVTPTTVTVAELRCLTVGDVWDTTSGACVSCTGVVFGDDLCASVCECTDPCEGVTFGDAACDTGCECVDPCEGVVFGDAACDTGCECVDP